MFSYISFRIQTYLGTNGPTGADVPLSIKQTNKQTNKRVFRAEARRTIRQNKRDCWRSYVSRITSQTPMLKIGQMIRRISGKADPAAISHLRVNNNTIEQPGEIADLLASTIAHNSSSDHYTERFQ